MLRRSHFKSSHYCVFHHANMVKMREKASTLYGVTVKNSRCLLAYAQSRKIVTWELNKSFWQSLLEGDDAVNLIEISNMSWLNLQGIYIYIYIYIHVSSSPRKVRYARRREMTLRILPKIYHDEDVSHTQELPRISVSFVLELEWYGFRAIVNGQERIQPWCCCTATTWTDSTDTLY